MIRWTALLVLGLWVHCSIASTTCECLWEGSFSEIASQADLVVLGAVEAVKGNSIDLLIERPITGKAWNNSVRVWLQYRRNCRPEVDQFPAKSRWIMALKKIKLMQEGGFNPFTPNVSFGRVGDFTLSSCGGYWLKVNGQRATGNLTPGMPRFSHEPKMAPVMIQYIEAFLTGSAPLSILTEASKLNPELEALKRRSLEFLRD